VIERRHRLLGILRVADDLRVGQKPVEEGFPFRPILFRGRRRARPSTSRGAPAARRATRGRLVARAPRARGLRPTPSPTNARNGDPSTSSIAMNGTPSHLPTS
jgi:hypothetical protein